MQPFPTKERFRGIRRIVFPEFALVFKRLGSITNKEEIGQVVTEIYFRVKQFSFTLALCE